jgi:hypothetical protein
MVPPAQRHVYSEAEAADWHRRNLLGETFPLIAQKTGLKDGRIRNVVAHYRKKHQLTGPGSGTRRSMRLETAKNAGFTEKPPAFLPAVTLTRDQWEQSNSCRYIQGDPRTPDAVYCGHPQYRKHLCKGHYPICWVPPPKFKPRGAA